MCCPSEPHSAFDLSDTEPVPSNKQLRDTVLGFIVAGRDTTSAALSWIMYELSRNPEVVSRLRTELENVVKPTSSSRPNNKNASKDNQKEEPCLWDRVQKLPYLHAVILEALRLHPPAPDNFRFAKTKDVLPDGTRIPAGALVQFSTYAINRCEDTWPDPDTFRPERFLGNTTRSEPDDPGQDKSTGIKEPRSANYPVFGLGPRACPGKNLALMELKTSVAYLVPRYTFEDVAGHNGDYHWTLVMCMKGGFPVRVKAVQ